MTTYNLGMPGNTHVEKLIAAGTIATETAIYYATMASAFEQRTASLIAWHDSLRDRHENAQATELADMIKGRLGL